MNQVLITIDDNISPRDAFNFLKQISFIKNIIIKKESKKKKLQVDEISLLSEKSLADEWLSKEDSRWDNLL